MRQGDASCEFPGRHVPDADCGMDISLQDLPGRRNGEAGCHVNLAIQEERTTTWFLPRTDLLALPENPARGCIEAGKALVEKTDVWYFCRLLFTEDSILPVLPDNGGRGQLEMMLCCPADIEDLLPCPYIQLEETLPSLIEDVVLHCSTAGNDLVPI